MFPSSLRCRRISGCRFSKTIFLIKIKLTRPERVFASRGDWFQVKAIPIYTMPREIERTGNERCKFTLNLSQKFAR